MNDNYNMLFENNSIFDKLSDLTRVVDPLKKSVLEYKSVGIDSETHNLINSFVHCYDFWSKNKLCDNCISMRAYNDNETYIKIEYAKDKVYMITAIPQILSDRTVVIEMIKDITNSIIIDSVDSSSKEQSYIHSLIENMNKLAFCDALTGVYNRRYIMEKLPVDLLNNTLLSMEMSIIMADIDKFKSVNDNYGHVAGDYVLENVVKLLSSCINRSNDWVARYGGEEFLICMPGADIETAKSTAECMREKIESTKINYDGIEFSVTSSFGIYNIKAMDCEGVDDVLKRADEKLYLAKRNGRNRVEF